MQTQLHSGLHLKFYNDSILEVYMDTTNVAGLYGLNLLDLPMSEVGVVLSSHILNVLFPGKQKVWSRRCMRVDDFCSGYNKTVCIMLVDFFLNSYSSPL